MDEEQANLEEQEIEQQEHEESTGKPEAQKPEDEEQEQEIVNDPVEGEEEKPVSRRESKRIQQLLDKFAERDAQQANGRTQAPERASKGNRQIIPEGEYDIDEINAMAAEYGKGVYEQALTQAQQYNVANTFATRLEIDVPRVNSKYTFLDQESQDFNPGVAAFVNRMYMNTVGYDQNTGFVQDLDTRYGDFVEGVMEMIEMVSAGRVADNTREVAQQAARTGMRPGGSRKPVYKGDDPSQMTDEQLEAAIKGGLGI